MHQHFTQTYLDRASDLLYSNGTIAHLSLAAYDCEPAIYIECFDRHNAIAVLRARVKISTLLLTRLGWGGWIVPTVAGEEFCATWQAVEEATQR